MEPLFFVLAYLAAGCAMTAFVRGMYWWCENAPNSEDDPISIYLIGWPIMLPLIFVFCLIVGAYLILSEVKISK